MDFTIHQQVLLTVFGIALALGAVAHKTNFCTMGAVSDWVNMGDTGRMRAWVLSMAVALTGVLILEATGTISLSAETFPPYRTANMPINCMTLRRAASSVSLVVQQAGPGRADGAHHHAAAGRPEVDRGHAQRSVPGLGAVHLSSRPAQRRKPAATPASTGMCRPVVCDSSPDVSTNTALATCSGSTSRLRIVRWA